MTTYWRTFLFLVLVTFMGSGVAVAKELEYEVIEDVYDDTTQIRTLTEQAPVADGKGWLIRTTLYTPHAITMDVVLVPVSTTTRGLFQVVASATDSVPDPISAPSSIRLEYEVIEDVFDDTTHIRSITEQAPVSDGKGWLIRTTLYTPHAITMDVVLVPVSTTKKGLFHVTE